MNIRTKDWSSEAIKVVAGNDTSSLELEAKLGPVVPSHTVVGKMAPYFCKR